MSIVPDLQEMVTVSSDRVETVFEGLGPPGVDGEQIRAAPDFAVALKQRQRRTDTQEYLRSAMSSKKQQCICIKCI